MHAPTRNKNLKIKVACKSALQWPAKSLLPTLLAVGGAAGIIASPAQALELGELEINSTLGQPLRASIAYALNPHEELYDFCIFLNKGSANELPTLTRAKVSVTRNQIILRGKKPLNEPMLAMRLTVNCPKTAYPARNYVHLARDYVVMINPPGTETTVATVISVAPVVSPQAVNRPPVKQQSAQSTVPASSKPAQRKPVATQATDKSPIQIGSDYRVQSGDTLSAIVSRIADRPLGLWAAVDVVFLANPDAFVNGDKNRLKAGNLLSIPSLQDTGVAANVEFTPAASYEDDTAVLTSGTSQEADNIQEVDSIAESAQSDKVATAQPGDIFIGNDIPADASLESADGPSIGIGDTRIVNQALSVPVSSTIKSTAGDGSWSWLLWLGGSGLALILGLLMFGRKIRGRFGGATTGSSQGLLDYGEVDEITQEPPLLSDVAFGFGEAISDSHSVDLAADFGAGFGPATSTGLDADPVAGTSLQDGVETDITQDFGFSATGENLSQLDLEIAADAAAEPIQQPTDFMPPQLNEQASILDSVDGEIQPDEDEDFSQQEMSMIVEAIKQVDRTAGGTTKDLKTIQVKPDKQEQTGFTLSNEADLKTLERDYEDEHTATQALVSMEAAEAAPELAERMDVKEVLDVTVEIPATADGKASDDPTTAAPLAHDANMTARLTAQLPTDGQLPADGNAVNDDFIIDLDNTGGNAELTAEMPQDDELTVASEIDSGTVDTKKVAG